MLRWLLVILSGGLLCLSAIAQTSSDILANDPNLSQFAEWIQTTNVTLPTDKPATLFAPTNDAIDSLPAAVRDLLKQDTALLTRVVQYHIVNEALPAAKLTDGPLTTQEGDSLTIVHAGDSPTVDGVLITKADAATDGLVVHEIASVLIPPIELPNLDPLEVSGDIVSAGSSTVFPLTQRMADRFSEQGYSDTLLVDSIGTGAGLERFCVAAETDIANASRAIKKEELAACQGNSREPIEFRVGTDALTVVVPIENTFVDNLTLEELAKVFSGAKTWQEIRKNWPAEPIHLYSPGTDSGTFDYFVEVVFKKDSAPLLAAQPTMSEDDENLVRRAEDDPSAITYFGYAYYLHHTDRLRVVAINGITPSEVTAENGTYPLARPLYIYSAPSIFQDKPQVASFIQFYLSHVNDEIVDVGYFPASDRALNLGRLVWLAAQKS